MKSEFHDTDRNTLALDRTVLANERTYQAWLRTGLAAFAAGLGIAKFLKGTMPLWILLTITTTLILFSVMASLNAAWRYCHLHVRMEHLDIDSIPTWMVKMSSAILAACSLLALIGLLITATY